MLCYDASNAWGADCPVLELSKAPCKRYIALQIFREHKRGRPRGFGKGSFEKRHLQSWDVQVFVDVCSRGEMGKMRP